jgi:hypothetical protein
MDAILGYIVILLGLLLALWKPKKRIVKCLTGAKQMNKDNVTGSKPKTIIKLALALIVIVGLCPPWIKTFKAKGIDSENPIGHHFIFKPPKTDIIMVGHKIDIARLLLYWGTVVIVAGGLVMISRKPEE